MRLTNRGILVIGGVVVLLVIFVLLTHKSSDQNSSLTTTSFSSPLTKAKDSLLINYGGSADPNIDSVVSQYKIFALNSLPLTSVVKKQLPLILPGYLKEYLAPTFGTTYIHIVRDTVKQKTTDAYSFDFYVDSPESYFHMDVLGTAGSFFGNPVTQIPWEGTK